ncbi:unnamed protein product [Rhizoctonia solani]|uniref:DEAD/DEAH box helicase domain-containing protein n=2 Tax=Rhizoctonia solani TaxID=456999 RepID=A0A8H3DVR8_9AGAM|nr:DEAD/DEAH-box helicase [Rhizoctonia solani AG-3 Rhs1AP]CAE6532970.1 unnamed protein product [Rhizoctonia solani]CAE6539612.1 unnamed protein product [Rhizoctonia solani]
MTKSSRERKNRDRALREAAKALSVAAKSLAFASDALSRLYDTDEDDTCTSNTDSGSISVRNEAHRSPRTTVKPVIDYEDSDDDEYMILAREVISAAVTAIKAPGTQSPIGDNKSTWSEMQNNFGAFGSPSKGDTESESGRMVDGRPDSSTFQPPSRLYHETLSSTNARASTYEDITGKPSKPQVDSVPPLPPKTWASLAEKWGVSVNTPKTNETFDANSTAGKVNDDPKQGATEPFANLKNRWVTPTEFQRKILRPLLAGSDMLLLHANLKSHVHAILAHCVKILGRERHNSNSGAISALVIVPQQTTGRLYLNYANELLSDFNLPHKAMLLPGGGSDVTIEAERMSMERVDILISSPRVFVNHVNSNPNLASHLARIRFVIYAGAHELTKTDIFLSFQFNMVKKRMPTRAKSPRQIIIAAAYMDDQIQVFASRGLHPGYITIHGAESDDGLQPESWDSVLNP